jgi:hypothetical protein
MMAAAILKILSSERLREKMAAESLKIAKTHDISHTLDQFEIIYNKLVKAET